MPPGMLLEMPLKNLSRNPIFVGNAYQSLLVGQGILRVSASIAFLNVVLKDWGIPQGIPLGIRLGMRPRNLLGDPFMDAFRHPFGNASRIAPKSASKNSMRNASRNASRNAFTNKFSGIRFWSPSLNPSGNLRIASCGARDSQSECFNCFPLMLSLRIGESLNESPEESF